MVDVREGRGTQNRNQEIEQRYRQQHGQQRSCDPDRREVLSKQAPGRPPSQAPYGNHSEVLTPEQETVQSKEDKRRKWREVKHESREIGDENDAQEACRLPQAIHRSDGRCGGMHGVVSGLDRVGDIVEENAGECGGDGYHQKRREHRHDKE